MSVDGTIIAKEIYVLDNVQAVWADYVFAKDYKLMPLAEVEKYISANKHLPNVPSADEVAEKGQGLGKLQIKQMEKNGSTQTMPFARPSFQDLLGAIDFAIAKDYPARGEYTGPL